MKMMKLLIPALAITAWAHTALATAIPSVWEIRACEDTYDSTKGRYVGKTEPVASKDSPLKGGEKVTFIIRMLNPDYNSKLMSSTSPWKRVYTGSIGEAVEYSTDAGPGVGIVVNGKTVLARNIDIIQPLGCEYFTDFIFQYEVQPGDIALPVRLAGDNNGTPASETGSIYWCNASKWKIVDAATETDTLTLQFPAADPATKPILPETYPRYGVSNWDMYMSGFYINTLKFAEQTAVYNGTSYWSVVNKDSTTCTPTPKIEITGDPDPMSVGGKKVYIWAEEMSKIKVVKGLDVDEVNLVDMPNSTGTGTIYSCPVGTITMQKGKTTYNFAVESLGNSGDAAKVYLSEHPKFMTRGSGTVPINDYLVEEMVIGDPLQPNITLTASPTSATVVPDQTTPIGTLSLKVSEVYPLSALEDEVYVTVTPSLTDTTGPDTVDKYVRISDNNTYWDTENTVYTNVLEKGVSANLNKEIYVFGLGADSHTSAADKPVKFTVAVIKTDGTPVAYYDISNAKCNLRLTPQKPVLTTDNTDVTAQRGFVRTFNLQIADNYKNLYTDKDVGYKVEWQNAEDSSWTALPDRYVYNVVDGNLVNIADHLTWPTNYYNKAEDKVTKFRVKSPKDDKVISNVLAFNVKVEEPPAPDYMSIQRKVGTEWVSFEENNEVVVGYPNELVEVRVKLDTPNNSGTTYYAFLQPAAGDVYSKGLASGSILTTDTTRNGMRIPNGKSESSTGRLYISYTGTDGIDLADDGTVLEYDLVLASSATDPSSGPVTAYTSYPIQVIATKFTPTYENENINIVPVDGYDGYFEGDLVFDKAETLDGRFVKANKDMRIVLGSSPAKEALTVKITKTQLGTDGTLDLTGDGLTDNGDGTYDITVPSTTNIVEFTMTDIDGAKDSRWSLKAEVTSTSKAAKNPAKKWNDYYIPVTKKLTINNLAPVLRCKSLPDPDSTSSSNAVHVAMGTGSDIKFTVDDAAADLAGGISVTWTVPGSSSKSYPSLTTTAEQTFTPEFKNTGVQLVQVTLEDKDGGVRTYEWWFDVTASKLLSTLAHGPSSGTSTSALSQRYATATGLGQGHVWADGEFMGANAFRLSWNMGTRELANFYAYGYKPTATTDSDDGTLDGGTHDKAIDTTGSATVGTTVTAPYNYGAQTSLQDQDGNFLDSYLYTWLVTTASEGGGMNSQICGSVAPERNGLAAAVGQIALPSEQNSSGGYAETILEAIFAKEWRHTDNCGDINQDGIPDVAVMKYGFKSAEGEDPDDLSDLSTYNEDEDYLPTHLNPDEWAIPKLSNTWATAVNAFNAKLEIRGYGPGLNNNTTDMTGVTAGVGLNDINSEKDWEPVEWESWNSLGRPLTWSPERPTDPTKADTDDDGLPDGYEYYYWYKSFVGYYDKNNKFQRLTGRKLVLAHPEDDGELITWEQIAEEFDPLLQGDDKADLRDIDNDGLSDYEEYVLGSSPIEWDTDGDGLSDFWEVHLAPSLLPYKRSTNDSTPDGLRNDDNDYMAQVSTNYMYVTTTIDPSNGRTVYYATQTDDSYSTALNGTVACIRFDIGSTKYAYVGSDVTTAAALITGVDTDGDLADDKWFLAIDVPLKDCYRLDSAGVVVDAAEFCKGTEVKDAGDDNPATALYDYYVYTGTASAAGTFDQDRSYLVWQYGRPGAYRASYKAMGREMNIPTTHPVVAHGATSEVVLLNHWQVYQWNGFHLDPLKDMGTGFSPTTAWMQNSAGYVGTRWQDPSELGGSHLDRMGGKFGNYSGVGRAMDTVGFCALDEFLVDAFFRYATGTAPQEPSITGVPISFLAYYNRYTTLPQDITTDDGTTYGADSDGDGVPDGWELYVQCGPGNVDTKTYKYQGKFEYSGASLVKFGINASAAPLGPRHKPGNWDSTKTVSMDPIAGNAVDDNLNEREEFYGTDSTAAYSGVPTIAEVTPFNARWRNKFWPTDPWSSDTDCDGISDGAETAFIYGSPTDTGRWWIAGGGLNPCAWDTDRDGLPDMWESQYRGVVYPAEDENGDDETIAIPRRLIYALEDFGYATNSSDIAKGCYGGMDGTVPDSFTGIEGGHGHNCDYDYDGLQNWQEYLTGTIRAFRYDDVTSPWQPYDTTALYAAIAAIVADTATYPQQTPPVKPSMADYDSDTSGLPLDASELAAYTAAVAAYTIAVGDYDNFTAAIAAAHDEWSKGLPASIGSLTDYPLNPIFRQGDFGTIEGAGINPNAIVGTFDWVAAYGSICRRAWDTSCGAVFFFPDGPNHALKRNTRITTDLWDEASGTLQNILRPVNAYERRILDTEAAMPTTLKGISSLVIQQNGPNMYFGTSPIAEDSDNDGMDDYYELFHGLNPLYGGEGGSDLISTAWRSAATGQLREMTGLRDLDTVSAKNNFWTYWYKGTTIASDSDYYDFVLFPWMNGSMEADPDGDDLRNQYEAIQPNIQANRTYLHTDPTPLWMTDSSYDKSITSFCYRPIVSLLAAYVPADGSVDANLWGVVSGWNWSFEENEGFDTDTDWYSDLREGQKGADPQDADSPSRRQAMYFPGGTTFGAVQVQEDMMISVLNNIKDNVQQFATFTVECWAKADNPAGGKQVLVERMIQNRGSNLGDQWFLRRNFQLGIDAGGYWYAAFDHDGTGDTALQSVVATSSSPAGTKWTHLAATYDGTALRLYVDGQLATSAPTALKPATGVLATLTSLVYDTEHYPISTFVTLGEEIRSYAQATAPRRAIIMGAGVAAAAGVENISSMALDEYTDANDYTYYYAGYLDEVRLWDGARSATEIANSYQTRMTKDDIAANRDEIYDGLAAYQTRDVNGSGVAGELPAELLYHFSFDNLASAETDTSIAQGPFGMAATTADARYVPSVPAGWISPAWINLSSGIGVAVPANSTVYGLAPYSMVPWIQNTVAHLPAYDGTSRDTVYWKEDFAGRTSASSLGYSKLFFPRTTDPYNHIQTMENITTVQYSHRSDTTPYFYYQQDEAKDSQYYQLYQFTRRNDMLRNTDALPLGAAYAKYSSDMWDGQGATTTSEVTGADTTDPNLNGDTDNNGVPDWADVVFFGATGSGKGLGDTITYGGLADTVAHHLARLLAKGANPSNPTGDTTYKQVADFNSSGVPDWWEEMYSLAGNGLADDDNDGLSNYTEYLLSEVLNTGKVFNPTVARSLDAYTLDYFVKIGQLYTGEIFTDHDQMEDEWEDNYSRDYATRMEYDANLDNEGDGWSTASEARYGQMVRPITASAISHINNFGETIADHPVPTLALTVGYHDQAFNAVSAAGMLVYVKHVDSEADYDAKYVIPVNVETGTTTNTLTQVLGRWSSRHAVGTLSPGHVKAGTIVLQSAYDPNAEIYSWRVQDRKWIYSSESFFDEVTYYRGSRMEYLAAIRKYGLSNVELLGTTSSYEDIKDISFRYDEDTRTATMQHQNGAVIMGTINMETGEYDIDLGVFKGGTLTLGTNTTSTVSSEDQTYRLVYEAASPGGIPRSLYLGQADVGAIKEGKNNVIVVADLDGDGLYTPGEPMGFVYGVEVGWKGGQADVTLTDTSPVSIRMNLVTGENDRDVVWADSADIDKENLDIVASASELGRYVRMRVVRAYANGADIPDAALQVPVIDRKVYLDSEIGKFLTEADFITAASPDVDWVNGAGLDVIDATNVQYRVMFGNADLTSNETIKPTAKYMFSRRFDANKYRAQVVTLAPGVNENYTVLDIRPTFKWRLDPVERDTYTAFRVVVTGTGFKYDSGVQLAPPRNAAGEYVWTAPICVSDQMAGAKFAGDTSTGVYANNATYNYTLYMYNAKFQSDAMGGTGTYYLSVPENSIATGNASIKVRYLGPAAAATGKTIHLQAFTTPDFVGDPVASTYVAGNANIDTVNADFAANATLVGLDKGTYYLRAFIDSDDNGVCDAWESAGYLCGQGMAGVGSIYNPVGMNFSTEVLGSTAVREIYIEDADTNQNTVPDAWEYATRGAVDLPAATIAASITQSDNIGITFNTDIGSKLLEQTTPGSVTEGMAGRVLLALNTPTVAALSMGYDTLEDAQAAVDTLDESASVVAITSLALDGTTATVGYTTDVNTVMSATAAKSAFYVTSGTTLSFQLVVKTKANLADEWTVADTRTVTVELGTEKSGEITVDVGALPEVAGFMTIELKK